MGTQRAGTKLMLRLLREELLWKRHFGVKPMILEVRTKKVLIPCHVSYWWREIWRAGMHTRANAGDSLAELISHTGNHESKPNSWLLSKSETEQKFSVKLTEIHLVSSLLRWKEYIYRLLNSHFLQLWFAGLCRLARTQCTSTFLGSRKFWRDPISGRQSKELCVCLLVFVSVLVDS